MKRLPKDSMKTVRLTEFGVGLIQSLKVRFNKTTDEEIVSIALNLLDIVANQEDHGINLVLNESGLLSIA